jgi:hypothetical protein
LGENNASMFHIFPVFSCRVRWLSRIFPARSGGRNDRPGLFIFFVQSFLINLFVHK